MRRRPPAKTAGPSNNLAVSDVAGVEGYSSYYFAPPTEPNVSNSEPGWNRQDSQRGGQPFGGGQPGGRGSREATMEQGPQRREQPGGGRQPGGSNFREAKVEQWGLAVPATSRTQRSGRSSRPVNGRLSDRQAGRINADTWDDDGDDDTLAWGAPSPSRSHTEGQAPYHSRSNNTSERTPSDQPVIHRQSRSDLSPAGDRPSSRGYGDSSAKHRGDAWTRAVLGVTRRAAAGSPFRGGTEDDPESGGLHGGASEGAHGSRQNTQEVHRRPYIPRQEKVRLMLQSNADIKAAYGDLTRALDDSSAAQDRALALKVSFCPWLSGTHE